MQYSVFIGRYQPLHDGHKKLIRTVLNEGKNVLVFLRDTGINEQNPFDYEARINMFRKKFSEEMKDGRLRVEMLPGVDIEEICYGRKVGWGIRQITLDQKTEAISATRIRKEMVYERKDF